MDGKKITREGGLRSSSSTTSSSSSSLPALGGLDELQRQVVAEPVLFLEMNTDNVTVTDQHTLCVSVSLSVPQSNSPECPPCWVCCSSASSQRGRRPPRSVSWPFHTLCCRRRTRRCDRLRFCKHGTKTWVILDVLTNRDSVRPRESSRGLTGSGRWSSPRPLLPPAATGPPVGPASGRSAWRRGLLCAPPTPGTGTVEPSGNPPEAEETGNDRERQRNVSQMKH